MWIGLDPSKRARREAAPHEETQPMKSVMKAVLVVSTLSSLAFAAEVDRREARQEARISQGVQSGELTAGEAAHLERREARTEAEIARDRAANGGKLTPAEKAKINQEQNRTSRQIYREKHNALKQ
jgi:hypothetical protein